MDEEKLYTKKELAEKWGISLPTIDLYMAQKKISFTKIGGSVRFTQSDLDEFMAKAKRPTIRDSSTQILALIPPDAKPRLFDRGSMAMTGQGDYMHCFRLCKDHGEAWEREIKAAAWHEPDLVAKMRILHANLEAVENLASHMPLDVPAAMCLRLAAREINLWDTEIKPNMKLPKKYLNPGKGMGVELMAKVGQNGVPPRSARVGGSSYPVYVDSWEPMPVITEDQAPAFFQERACNDIRISKRIKEPITIQELVARDNQAVADRAKAIEQVAADLVAPKE